MNWRNRIVATPDVVHGQPRIEGTRIPVTVVLDNVAAGHSAARILESYPSLRAEDLGAAIAFAAELARDHSATRLVHRSQGEEISEELEADLLESMAQADRGECRPIDELLVELRNPPRQPTVPRREIPNQPMKRVPLDEWVNDHNPPEEAQYSKGYWDLVEFARHMASRFDARGTFAVGTHVIQTPPPEENLTVPIVCLELDGASVVLELDFGVEGWPDPWRAGVKLDRPLTGPTLGLFDPSLGAGRDPRLIEELGFPPFAQNAQGFSCRLADEWDVAMFLRLLVANAALPRLSKAQGKLLIDAQDSVRRGEYVTMEQALKDLDEE